MGGPSCSDPATGSVATTAYPYPSSNYAASTATSANTQPPYVMGSAVDPHYINSTNTGTDNNVPMYLQERQGSTCCGCCCDFRRATIIVNSVIIGLSTFSLFSLFNRPDNTEETLQLTMDITDDAVLEDLAQVVNDSLLAGAIMGGVLLVLTAVPLYGAYMFDTRMLVFGVVLLVATLITEILLAYIYIEQADDVVASTQLYEFNQPIVIYTATALLQILFIYPHIGLILEIRAGTMSFETYPRETYSVCCGGPRPPPVVAQQQQQQQEQQVQLVPVSNGYNTNTTTMNGQPPPQAPPDYHA